MEEPVATRSERFWLAFGLACLPCTAAFLFAFGGVLLGALLTWQGFAVVGALAAVVGAIGFLVVRRRRSACPVVAPDASG